VPRRPIEQLLALRRLRGSALVRNYTRRYRCSEALNLETALGHKEARSIRSTARKNKLREKAKR
jgi:hypothetical protein